MAFTMTLRRLQPLLHLLHRSLALSIPNLQTASPTGDYRPSLRSPWPTAKAFCRENSLNYDQFVYWRRKLAQTAKASVQRATSALVPVTCTAPTIGQDLSLLLPNGMELRGLTQDNLPVVQQLLAQL